MPPTLTEQQKTAIQAYTPEQRAKYNQYRSGGFSAVEAINILNESGATVTQRQTLPSKIGERIKTSVDRTLTDFSTPTEAVKSISQFRPLVRGAGAAGGIVGDVIAEGLERVTPEVVKETLTPVAETIAQAPITQKIAKVLGAANESSDFLLGDVANALNLVGISALPRTIVRVGITEGIEQGVARGTRSLADFVKKVEVKTPDITPSTVVENIRETITAPTATEAIESATRAGVENLDDSIIRGAVSRGLSQEDAVLLGRLTAEDKAAASKLVDAAENAAIDTAAPTVTDIIARDLITPVKSLLQKNNEFGKAVDKAAKELVGKKTDVDKIRAEIDTVLSEYGVSQGSKGLEFTSGKLRFAPAALKKEIQTLVTEASKDLIKNDAYQLHTLKQAIDGAAFGGTSKTAAEKAANNILKGMRRAIDNQLDADFPVYKAANEDSAYLMGFMKEMQSVFGKGKQLTEARAAAQLKSLTGTAAKRGDVENFLKLVDEAAKKYGLKGAGNLRQKADLARLLTRVYGTPASADIAQAGKAAVSGVTALARSIRNPMEGIGQAVGKGIEKLAGQTPQAQREFLRKTLRQDDVVDTPEVATIVSTDLIEEAKKYKSAEEFVKSQPTYYHGGRNEGNVLTLSDPLKNIKGRFGNPSPEMTNSLSITNSKSLAESFGAGGSGVTEVFVNPKKILDLTGELSDDAKKYIEINKEELNWNDFVHTWGTSKKAGDFLKTKGYDAIKIIPENEIGDGGIELRILDSGIVNKKEELTDIWKKANGKTGSTALLEEAKKLNVDDMKKYFQLLPQSYLKKPKMVYRGVSESGEGLGASGGGAAVEGYGLYTTTKKSVAEGYAKHNGQKGRVLELNPEEAIPKNPLYFRNSDAVKDWTVLVSKEVGINPKDFETQVGINNLVKSLGYDGVAFDMNGGVTYVKYPD